MSTRRGGTDSSAAGNTQPLAWVCDHGAPWFTAESETFRAEVAKWHQAGVAACWTLPDQPDAGTDGNAKQPNPPRRIVGLPHMTSPAAFLAASLSVSQQTTVVGLVHRDHQWQLRTTESGMIADQFDAVALAVPAPQVIPLLSSAAAALSDATVSGIISAMAATAAARKMRGTWVLMLQFDAPVVMPFGALVGGGGPLGLIVRNSAKPGRLGLESWAVHASVEWSEAHLEDPAETVAAALLAAFNTHGGPTPRSSSLHRWRYAASDTAPVPGTTWDSVARLGMCGDWTAGGTVEAAWQSGQHLAQQIICQNSGGLKA